MKGILTGYTNAILKNKPTIEQEAKRRLTICQNCNLKKTVMGVDFCNACSCPLAPLTRQNQKICKKW